MKAFSILSASVILSRKKTILVLFLVVNLSALILPSATPFSDAASSPTADPDGWLDGQYYPVDLSSMGGKKGKPIRVKGVWIDGTSWIRLKSTDEKRLSLDVPLSSPQSARSIAVLSNLDDATYLGQGAVITKMTVSTTSGPLVFDIQAGIHASEWNYKVGPPHKNVHDPEAGRGRTLALFTLPGSRTVTSIRFDYKETGAKKWSGHSPGFCLGGITLIRDPKSESPASDGGGQASPSQETGGDWVRHESTSGLYSLTLSGGGLYAKSKGKNPGGVQNGGLRLAKGLPVAGDFDVSVRFSDANIAGGLNQIELQTGFSDGAIFFVVRDREGKGSHIWAPGVKGDQACGNSGVLRIVRRNGTVTGYCSGKKIWSDQRKAPLSSLQFVLQNNNTNDPISVIFSDWRFHDPHSSPAAGPDSGDTGSDHGDGEIVVWASEFVRPVNVALSGIYGADVLLNAPPYNSRPNAAEWEFSVPRGGAYRLKIEYAAAQSRPCRIILNGNTAIHAAMNATTGCWQQRCQRLTDQGIVRLVDGINVMRVERDDVFPHIKKFVFIRTGASGSHETSGSEAGQTVPDEKPAPLKVTLEAAKTRVKVNEPVRLSAQTSGGTPPYSFLWSGGHKTQTPAIEYKNATPGDMILAVKATDANGQTATGRVKVKIVAAGASETTGTTGSTGTTGVAGGETSSQTHQGPVRLSLSKSVYQSHEPVVVEADGLPPYPHTIIYTARAGSPVPSARQTIKTGGKNRGTFRFKPLEAGQWEIRVGPDMAKGGGYTIVASQGFTVENPPLKAELGTDKKEYNPTNKAAVEIRPDSPVSLSAVLVLVPADAPSPPESGFLYQQKYLLSKQNRTIDIKSPQKPGKYEWRLYCPDLKGEPAARAEITVVPLGPDSPTPKDWVRLPFGDGFNPGAECWVTSGLNPEMKKHRLYVNTEQAPLQSAFSIPFEDVLMSLEFFTQDAGLILYWGTEKNQGYGLKLQLGENASAALFAGGLTIPVAQKNLGRLPAGRWRKLGIQREKDELSLTLDGKKVLSERTARRYKGGAPLRISGGASLGVANVFITRPDNYPGMRNPAERDARFCQCGPKVLETWDKGKIEGWQPIGDAASAPLFYLGRITSPADGTKAVRTRLEAKEGHGQGPMSLRKTFKIGKADSSTAFLKAYFEFDVLENARAYPHIQVALLDDAGEVKGTKAFFPPDLDRLDYAKLKENGNEILDRRFGVSRIDLAKVTDKPVAFSQVAVSLGNAALEGYSEVVMDQLVFCPDEACTLEVEEKADIPAILADLDKGYEILRDQYILFPEELEELLGVPEIPEIEVPKHLLTGTGGIVPAVYIEPQSSQFAAGCPAGLLFQTVGARQCTKALDQHLTNMRRLDITLGRSADLLGALKDLGKTMLDKLPIPKEYKYTKKTQEFLNAAVKDYEDYIKLTKNLDENDTLGFINNMNKKLLSMWLSEVEEPTQLENFNAEIQNRWGKWLKTLSPKQQKFQLKQLKRSISHKLNQSDPAIEALKQAGTVDEISTALGKLEGAEYKQACWAVFSSTAGIFQSSFANQMAIVEAAAKTTYQGMLAGKEMIEDMQTQKLYEAYKKHHDEGLGGDDFHIAHSLRDRVTLTKVKEVMKHKGLVRYENGKQVWIDDETARKYLHGQFEQWKKAEAEAEKKADALSIYKDDFLNLDDTCRQKLNRRTWPNGYRKAWDRLWNWRSKCDYDVAVFEAYAKLRYEIRDQWKGLNLDEGKCKGDTFMETAVKDLLCNRVDSEALYKQQLTRYLQYCDLMPKNLRLLNIANKKRVLKKLRRLGDYKLIHLLTHMKREDLLGCLCCYNTASDVGCGYQPGSTWMCPAATNGKNCLQGNWGCIRSPVPTNRTALLRCGIPGVVSKYQIENLKVRQ